MKDNAKKRRETAKEIEKDGVREVRNRQAEEALRASEERYRLLAQTANDAIITVDTEGNITFWNNAAKTIFGYSYDEAIGKSITFVIPKRFHKTHENGMKQLVLTGESKIIGKMYEVTGLRKNRSEFPVELSTTSWKTRKGLFFTGIVRDITERKQAEKELRKREQEFMALVENAPDIISRFDKMFRHVYINPAVERESGKPPGFFIGKTNQELGTPEELIVEWHKALESVFETGQETTIETKYPTPTGTKYYSNRLAPEFSEDGSVETVLNISRDITKQKQVEDELRKHREHLESLVEQRTKELKSTNVKLRQEITKHRKAEERLLDYQKQLRSLASELSLAEERERKRIAIELHDRIAQSLAFTKIKLGALGEKVSSSDGVRIIEELHETFEQLIRDTRSLTFELASPILYELGLEKAIEWLVEYIQKESGLSIDFKNDEKDKLLSENIRITLFQAVREAMINVVKHAQAQKIDLSVEKMGNDIRIEVVDDGIGFDVAKVIPWDARRSGFGLFSMRERIQYLGGNFEVHSEPGLGTRIILSAPLAGEKS